MDLRPLEAAKELHQAAITLIRYKHGLNGHLWRNLANAANRFNAALQQAKLDELKAKNDSEAKGNP